jgi:signal transduction histidine kinase
VNLHGGEVTVTSEVGSGTTFSVHLALSNNGNADGEPETSAQALQK